VGYESIDEKHRKQEAREGSGDVTVLDTDEYFPTFARESKAQSTLNFYSAFGSVAIIDLAFCLWNVVETVRRDSKRAREDLNDFNVDSSL
jgi:hypothetical protein